ncbi:hypothetical protein B4U80_06331 [Leptotrombidium deliense]|uniref:serine--tRNA ligase n=1 Tax=Leptotrombidium deliense TaxID=299467 RepID=A0A443S9E4_9ACAR|nr:hypothetical protein B4U80_06331 [Leptotrombidium deliense]
MCSNYLRHGVLKLQKAISSRRFIGLSTLQNWQTLLATENYETQYWLNESNFDEIIHNLELRSKESTNTILEEIRKSNDIRNVLEKHIHKLPNKLNEKWLQFTSEEVKKLTDKQLTVKIFGDEKGFRIKVKRAESLLKGMGLCFDQAHANIALVGGPKSYVLVGDAARLQHAIVEWAMTELIVKFQFIPVSVPHIVREEVVEGCGFDPKGLRTQVYKLRGTYENQVTADDESDNLPCLIGTSEIPIAALHMGHTFDSTELPKKYCCLSRCYRSETHEGDMNLYRVHYFTKVEMFAITEKGQSMQMLQHFLDIQEYLYSQLGILCRVLDMPPHELGSPAARKFDIEAWMPYKRFCGEISSASDCTDYQSRRFNIKYRKMEPNYETNEPFKIEFVSTVNGTAVALPRLLIPLIEYNQKEKQFIIPEVLRSYMDGKSTLEPSPFS